MRWIVFQYHGFHGNDSMEAMLHDSAGPFLWGMHKIGNPDFRRWNAEQAKRERVHSGAKGLRAEDLPDEAFLARFKSWRDFEHTRVEFPPAPPAGGYAHLSWCYHNLDQTSERFDFRAGARYMLEADPGVRLLLWLHMPHPDLPPLLAMLQAEYRGRHVSVYHKRSDGGQTEADGAGIVTEDWLWQHVDLHYFSGCALVGRGITAFCDKHKIGKPYLLTLHGPLTRPDMDRAVARAETVLSELEGAKK